MAPKSQCYTVTVLPCCEIPMMLILYFTTSLQAYVGWVSSMSDSGCRDCNIKTNTHKQKGRYMYVELYSCTKLVNSIIV